MNQRLTAAAAIAVILACGSEFFLIHGFAWLVASAGAVTVVALAGLLTRQAPIPAAIGATMLAALATVPLFAASAPALKAGGALIVICCAASATRWRVLRAIAGLITYLAALLLYLNAVRAGSQSLGLIVPTKASLHHLIVLANNGMAQAKNYPPVSQTAGVILVAAGSIGLAAIVIDFLAVRLHRPAIAGLPLLVIYLAPLATSAHVQGPWGITAFLTAAAGYLGLLASDGRTRLRSWGRVISVWHRPGEGERLGGADVAALAATGRRIGVAALCAAVIAPLLLPSLNLHHLFGQSPDGGQGGGVGLPNPVDQMRGLLNLSKARTVLTYRSDSATGQYLHVYVLNYDPAKVEWLPTSIADKSPVTNGVPMLLPPGVSSSMRQGTTTLNVTMDTTGYASPVEFLPAPYWPVQLTVGGSGNWWESHGTLMLFAGQVGQQAKTYTVTSGLPEPTHSMLEASPRAPADQKQYLGFKSPETSKLTQIARIHTSGQRTAFDKAVALERWFHSGKFLYSVNSDIPNTPRGLLDFLTSDPQGFCQQFAFAMAVLARLIGIPSRVVIGFTGGTLENGQWVVTTADAHAWPELYFQGAGWLRFEPTPDGGAGQGTAVEPSYVTTAPTDKTTPKGKGPHTTGPANRSQKGTPNGLLNKFKNMNKLQDQSGHGPTVGSARKGHGIPLMPIVIALAAVLLAGIVAPGTARIVARRRRWRTAVSDVGLARAAWREVRSDMVDLGIPCRASDSPRAVARRICSSVEGDEAAQQAVGRIATVVERAYYAQAPASAETVRGDVAIVRRSLASSVNWHARWRARLLPASVLGPTRAAVARSLGSITGWVPVSREEATA